MQRNLLLLLCVLMLFGCSGAPLRIPTPAKVIEGTDYQVLGYGEGSSTGIMLFQFIPIGQNDRFGEAYNRAVLSRGGTRLIDPSIEESWFWAYILNGYKTKVSGTVVKDIFNTQATDKNTTIKSSAEDTAEKIINLKKLLDDGLITKEDFEIKKKKYIDEL